jgi:nicotinate-nucleotide adenylyltransferase
VSAFEGRRIGLFGGSFDPPHIGHFIAARAAAEAAGLDEILVIPAYLQPHKPEGHFTPAEVRLQMVEACIRDDPLFCSSRIEIDRGGVSFTVDTLRELSLIYPSPAHQLVLILGADALLDIERWKEPDAIFQLAEAVILDRPGSEKPELPARWSDRITRTTTPLIDVSSTGIRSRVLQGLSIRWLTPEPVVELIREHRLYLHKCKVHKCISA